MIEGHLLSVLIWLPIVGGAGVLALGESRAQVARWVSLGVAGLTLICTTSASTASRCR
jgi:NADH-quinone oxidoreductase subunit M